MTTGDWFRASCGNDITALKKFLAGGFSADIRDAAGDSALHAAAGAGAQSSADFLLSRGLAIDLLGAAGRTPLMAAVIGDQTAMVRWLLRQGANPKLKDNDGFKPLMLAVREGKFGPVAELAASNREDLDPALLLAALVGRADVIDALTNFGASVHARMEDGRTPLMIAAENGQMESVKLLLDIGASRYATHPDGRTAADIATAAGHAEIAAMISRDPLPGDLALESPAEIAQAMDEFVDTAAAKGGANLPGRVASISIEGETLSGPVAAPDPAVSDATFPMPPLVMRHYREKDVPIRVMTVQGETATVRIDGASRREVRLRAGDSIPGSNLVVVRVKRQMEDSKVSLGKSSEISVVEVRDTGSGNTRQWMAGIPANSHDPVALVEDAATGKRYVASSGQRFTGADGAAYLVSEIRPNQLVIKHLASGAVRTIPLRGPRG